MSQAAITLCLKPDQVPLTMAHDIAALDLKELAAANKVCADLAVNHNQDGHNL